MSSPHLWQRLVRKTDSLLEKLNASHLNNILQLMEVIWVKGSNYPLMIKCDRLLDKYVGASDLPTIYSILRTYTFMRFFRCEYAVAVNAKLIEDIDRCDHPDSFSNLYATVVPSVSFKMRER